MMLSEILFFETTPRSVFMRQAWAVEGHQGKFHKCLCRAAYPNMAQYHVGSPDDELVPCMFGDVGQLVPAFGQWALTAEDIASHDWEVWCTAVRSARQNKTAPGVPEAVLG